MRALLDINVIIALLDSEHAMHRAAQLWMDQHKSSGWASCPVTQNGVIRIMSQPAYPNSQPTIEVATRLSEACKHPSHHFRDGGISLLDQEKINWQRILGPRQITDAYLLAVAVANDGCLISFDQRITHSLVAGAKTNQIKVIKPG